MSDSIQRSRVSKGVPTGGEFATMSRAENDDMPEYGADFYIEDDTDYSTPAPTPAMHLAVEPQGPFAEPAGIITGSSSSMIEQYPHAGPVTPQDATGMLPSEARREDDYRRYKREERDAMETRRVADLIYERDGLRFPRHRGPRQTKEDYARMLVLTEQVAYQQETHALPGEYRASTSDWVRGRDRDLNGELLTLNPRLAVLEGKLIKRREDRAEIATIQYRQAEIRGFLRAHRDREEALMEGLR